MFAVEALSSRASPFSSTLLPSNIFAVIFKEAKGPPVEGMSLAMLKEPVDEEEAVVITRVLFAPEMVPMFKIHPEVERVVVPAIVKSFVADPRDIVVPDVEIVPVAEVAPKVCIRPSVKVFV